MNLRRRTVIDQQGAVRIVSEDDTLPDVVTGRTGNERIADEFREPAGTYRHDYSEYILSGLAVVIDEHNRDGSYEVIYIILALH